MGLLTALRGQRRIRSSASDGDEGGGVQRAGGDVGEGGDGSFAELSSSNL